jgi:YD repeat-containing protein
MTARGHMFGSAGTTRKVVLSMADQGVVRASRTVRVLTFVACSLAAFLFVGAVSASAETFTKAERERFAEKNIAVHLYTSQYEETEEVCPPAGPGECSRYPFDLPAGVYLQVDNNEGGDIWTGYGVIHAGIYCEDAYKPEGCGPYNYYEGIPYSAVKEIPGRWERLEHKVWEYSDYAGGYLVSTVTAVYYRENEEREAEERGGEELGEGNPGEPDRHGCRLGKPVNCATGNQTIAQTDLAVGGRGPALELTRTYNSRLAAKQSEHGSFGFGWTGSYSAHLELKEEGQEAIVHQDNGSTVTFIHSGGSWTATSRLAEATLAAEGTGYVYTLPNQTKLYFNGSGQITSEADRDGNALTMGYESGRLASVTDAAARKITLAYNAEGEVESAKDSMGHTVKYAYEAGDLKSVTQPAESTLRWQFKYNSEHELTSETDGRGNAATTEYNGSQQVISQIDALSRKREWKYTENETGTETKIAEPNGATTVEQFNEYGSPTSVTHAAETSNASTTTYEYDGADELLTFTDPNKHETEYSYDSSGNKVSEKNADGDETKWKYDSTHDVETETKPEGETTTIKRNSHGDPEVIERPAPGGGTQKTAYKYASDGDVESMTNPLEHTWKYEYDSYGDRKSETDPEGNKRTWTYNEDSQETSTVSPRGHVAGAKESKFTTTIERDAQGRQTKTTDPLGHETKYTYDGDGNLETETDPEGNRTTYVHNADDQPIKVEEPDGATTETEYDSAGEIVKQTDGNKHATEYKRNALEEVTEVIDPLGRKTLKEYDTAGNLIKLTDPAKRVTTYSYDPANRLTEVGYSSGNPATVKYEYNKDGDRTKVTDGTGTTTYTYDQLDRLTESETGHKEIVEYEYDLANNQTKITYPNGKAITRAYDSDSRLKSVTDWLEHTTSFGYGPDSDLTSTTFPTSTGDVDTYMYDNADQMSEVEMKKGSEALASLAYTRSKDGGVTKVTTKGLPGEERPSFSYDESSRVTKGAGIVYKYDAANNPTEVEKITYAYNAADELENSVFKKSAVATYAYNELGERTKTTPSSGPATTYGYDQAGNLISVERPEKESTPKIEDAYAYNGEGLRTSQTISGTTSYLAWDMAEELPLILSDGTNSYIYGPGGLPVEQINSTTGAVGYLHHDQAGSTRLITGSSGTVTGKCTYSAYGTSTC